MQWIVSDLKRDFEFSGIVIYFNSIQEITDADYTLISANAQFSALVTKGVITVYNNKEGWAERNDVKYRTIRYTTKQTFSDKSLNDIPVDNELVTNVTVPEVIKEFGPDPVESLVYKLYAYEMSVDEDTIAYAEKPTPEVGDVIFLKATMSQGPITDPSQLTVMGEIATVGTEGAITVEIHEGETPVAFVRKEDDDWTETITDVKDAIDVVTNGLIVADKGKVTKAVNVKTPVAPSKLYAFAAHNQTSRRTYFMYTPKEELQAGETYAGGYFATSLSQTRSCTYTIVSSASSGYNVQQGSDEFLMYRESSIDITL